MTSFLKNCWTKHEREVHDCLIRRFRFETVSCVPSRSVLRVMNDKNYEQTTFLRTDFARVLVIDRIRRLFRFESFSNGASPRIFRLVNSFQKSFVLDQSMFRWLLIDRVVKNLPGSWMQAPINISILTFMVDDYASTGKCHRGKHDHGTLKRIKIIARSFLYVCRRVNNVHRPSVRPDFRRLSQKCSD